MYCRNVFFNGHAIQRMFERGITDRDVASVIVHGESIAEYPDDKPFPSMLMLGFVHDKPLHVVLGVDEVEGSCYVITVYIPDVRLWYPDFKRRRI